MPTILIWELVVIITNICLPPRSPCPGTKHHKYDLEIFKNGES